MPATASSGPTSLWLFLDRSHWRLLGLGLIAVFVQTFVLFIFAIKADKSPWFSYVMYALATLSSYWLYYFIVQRSV